MRQQKSPSVLNPPPAGFSLQQGQGSDEYECKERIEELYGIAPRSEALTCCPTSPLSIIHSRPETDAETDGDEALARRLQHELEQSEDEAQSSEKLAKRDAVTAFQQTDILRFAAERRNSLAAPVFKKSASAKLQEYLFEVGDGSTLRGWRRLLDPDGYLTVPWKELFNTCLKGGVVQSAEELHACMQSEVGSQVHLEQLLPDLGLLLVTFRRFIRDQFGSQSEWFDAFNTAGTGCLTREIFCERCEEEGFEADEDEINELYSLCDFLDKDSVTKHATIFLEPDADVRDRGLLKLKKNEKYETDKLLVACYNRDAACWNTRLYNVLAGTEAMHEALDVKELSPKHRLAMRPWARHHYESLPIIARQRKVARDTLLRQNCLQARVRFIRYLRKFHGTEVRAWRRGLDPNGKFVVSKSAFQRYCREIQFDEDMNALWRAFDPAGEGEIFIEQLSMHAADVLATFHSWAHQCFGSCTALMQTPEAIKRRQHHRKDGSSFLKDSMSTKAFSSLLWAYAYPPLFGQDGDDVLWYILVSFDFYGGNLISCSDMQWLDDWTPTDWLVVEPDNEAWDRIRVVFEERYGHLLRAWRQELDADNSNMLTWTEWREACKRLHIDDNIAGAWRLLDGDRLGYIGLKDMCEDGAKILRGFKSWAETRFGSMHEAFHAMDYDGGGTLSLAELKGSCFRFKCASDPDLLFDVLSSNGRSISYKDFQFLNDWVAKKDEVVAELAKVTEELWKEVFSNRRDSKASLRPQSAGCGPVRRPQFQRKPPARPPTAALTCFVPADAVLGTQHVSPYALPVRPRSATAHRKVPRRKALSDVGVLAC